MALYHCFNDKQALRHTLVEQAYAPLFALRPRLAKLPTPELKLRLLAKRYLLCTAKALPLTRHLAVRGGSPLATKFSELFGDAIGNLAPPSGHTALRDVLVDYLNGAALAGPRHAAKAFNAGWSVLMAGFRQYLAHDTTTKDDNSK